MRRYFGFLLFLFLLIGFSVRAVDFDNDGYGQISDYLDDAYGIDDNAGLTAFPVLNIPMGGRSEGMGTAFAAVADDVSFIEYNPAGSSRLPVTELGVFHNNWIADTKIESAVFATRPKKLSRLGLGVSAKWLYTPFTEYNVYGERVSKGYYSEAAAILNASYNFFSNYYFSGLSVGVNLKGAFRYVPDYSDSDNMENPDGKLVSGSGMSQTTGMGMGDIGLLTRFNFLKGYVSREPNTSAALVIKNIGPPSMDDPLPGAAVAAFAYRPIRPLVFAFDFTAPFNLMDISLSEFPYAAFGVAVDVTKFLSMRTGLLVKKGNFRAVLGSAVIIGQISLDVNYSADLLTQIRPMNRISLALRFNLGDQGRKKLSDQVDEFYLLGLDAYAKGNIPLAQSHMEDALKLDRSFSPAKEFLDVIRKSQAVQDQMNELQRLNF